MVGGGGPLRGSVRWAYNTRAWEPTEQEWLLASRCIPLEEKQRVQKFVFKADAKAAMAGCLMIRKLAHLVTGDPNDKIEIIRENGRPRVKTTNIHLDFNISHQGHFTVLAGEVGNDVIVGADVMNLHRKTGSHLSEFFRLMNKTCSSDEWNTILSSNSEEQRAAMFFRFWCLKESFTKATGVGVRSDMRHISFQLRTPWLNEKTPVTDTFVEIDRVKNSAWCFHEWLLDPKHCVAVALSSKANTCPNVEPVPFTFLTLSDLLRDLEPMLPPDVISCHSFLKKEESGRAHEDSVL
ncbi:L-aminoadipate-semialdehyde dehydrogenase-phosphopantetheinyl transferase-like [Thrips palmi]|uniref:L-aminoadipate-semialdehyde dehydrogenase-phosphopantetheinyl transferase n=1 Tax=Thrips palmi TaxID=161013 RepID=A0A6P8ZJ41_THRPL|nr:L-aminoadipate-semialdehyde dehydrogenase-phosphopantetheinyl transferase-like [Thrips palmi]XP_034234694.1 L-aminoadipate-semialdehyde dehydrogenase-phosphopantetheinyl transferase-like [Thrips palmi]XP_034234696.1 L-aminoadipate-semialdehyde dehydrogenase-phosphopantetheinyl transferase-like [Thrips palmi]